MIGTTDPTSNYDLKVEGEPTDNHVHIEDLRYGEYYLYAVGYYSSNSETVKDGIPVAIKWSQRKEIENKTPAEVKKVTEPKKVEPRPETPKEVVKERPTEPVKTVVQPKETVVTKNEVKPVEKAPETKREPAEIKKVEKELAVVKQELAKKVEAEAKKKEFSENVIDGKIVFLKVVKYDTAEGHFNSELHLIDPAKDDAVLKSDFNKICSRQFKEFGNNIVVVGFKDGHKDEHQLYLMSKTDLKEVGKSTSNVFS